MAVSAAEAAQQGKQWSELRTSGNWLGWLEFDPLLAGHRLMIAGVESPLAAVCVTAAQVRVASRVHEYGGGAWCLFSDGLVYSNAADQSLYWIALSQDPSGRPVASQAVKVWRSDGCRYGDLTPCPFDGGKALIAVEEDHSRITSSITEPEPEPEHTEPQNRLVLIQLPGGVVSGGSSLSYRQLLAEGEDFYSSPALSADGQRLCWLSWSHPDQPWLNTRLYDIALDPQAQIAGQARRLLGSEQRQQRSLFQPGFLVDGSLLLAADDREQNLSWGLLRLSGVSGEDLSFGAFLNPYSEHEYGVAQWTLGLKTWAASEQFVLCSRFRQGIAELVCYPIGLGEEQNPDVSAEQKLEQLGSDVSRYHSLCYNAQTRRFYGLLESSCQASRLVEWSLAAGGHESGARILCQLGAEGTVQETSRPSASRLTQPIAVEIATSSEQPNLFAWFYPAPAQHEDDQQTEAKSKLIVQLHGGPTAMADKGMDWQKQFWLDQGFSLLVLNYRGSSGFGLEYRHALAGQWGITDLDDTLAACRYALQQKWADAGAVFVRGNSAGGYSVLRVLSDRRARAAGIAGGASLYGISDLGLLDQCTHKFESRYLSWLLGQPYEPLESADVEAHSFDRPSPYLMRSPIRHLDSFELPVIFFQGAQDRVVPPEQTRMIYDRLKAKSVLTEYHLFKGEGHGFRMAQNREALLTAESDFYRRILSQR
jgi:acetyl esterase/lipase